MSWVINLMWIGIGLVVLFWGYKLFRIWLALSGFVLGGQVGYILANYYTESEVLPLVGGLVAGLLIGALAFFFYRLGAILVGMLLGGALSIVVFFLFGMLPTWWIFFVGAVPFALLAAFLLKPFVKIGSSLNGAYQVTLGIYALLEGTRASIVLSGDIPWYFYVAMAILAAIGIGYQFSSTEGQELDTGKPQTQ